MTKNIRVAIPLLLVLCLIGPRLQAEGLKAVRVAQGPKMDGLVTDDVWRSAEAFTAFRQADPRPGDDPSEPTELRILYDHANLYIGVLCRDSEPSRISANNMAHDGGGAEQGMHYGHTSQSASDDLIRVLLDPFQDKRSAYIFFVNPLGARGEGLAYAGESSLNWDGIWEAKGRRLDEGWSAELSIPFKTISFKPGLAVWGINVERVIARRQETIRLSGTNRDCKFENPMEAAALRGIEDVAQGKGITFRPYGLASAGRERPARRDADRRRRVRHLQELHAQPGRGRQLQHGFRRDRGRRAPHQPDPLPPVLPGEADVLPRGLGDLQLQLEPQLHALHQPQDRAPRGTPDPGRLRDQALRQDRRLEPLGPGRPDGPLRRGRRPQPLRRPDDAEHLRREQGRLDPDQRQSHGRAEHAGRHGLQLLRPPGSWGTRT